MLSDGRETVCNWTIWYWVTGLHFCINIMESICVILCTRICVPSFYSKHWMYVHGQVINSSVILINCNCNKKYIYGNNIFDLHINLCLNNWIYFYFYCFPHALLLHIWIHLQILYNINCIINCNIVPYSYFPQCSVTTYPVYTPTDYEIY